MALFTAFNIGRDMSLQIAINGLFGSSNPAISPPATSVGQFSIDELGILETFECDPVFADIEVRGINLGGASAFRDDYRRWEGHFSIVRQTAASDYLMNVLQDAFLAGSGSVTATISQTIYDSRGPASGTVLLTWQNAVLKPAKAGSYETDSKVAQEFSFRAGKRDITSVVATAGATVTASDLEAIAATLKIIQ